MSFCNYQMVVCSNQCPPLNTGYVLQFSHLKRVNKFNPEILFNALVIRGLSILSGYLWYHGNQEWLSDYAKHRGSRFCTIVTVNWIYFIPIFHLHSFCTTEALFFHQISSPYALRLLQYIALCLVDKHNMNWSVISKQNKPIGVWYLSQ